MSWETCLKPRGNKTTIFRYREEVKRSIIVISVGYTDEDGILVSGKDAFTRTNVSSYVSGDITPWLSTSMDMKYNSGDKRYPFLDGSSELGIWKTNLPSYHPDGMLPYGTDGQEYLVMTPANVISMAKASKSGKRR